MATELEEGIVCSQCGAPARAECGHTNTALPKVESPKEEYGELRWLFQMEQLGENFDAAVAQLEKIKELIETHSELEEKHKTDLDVDHYLDEAAEKIDTALKNFAINGKTVDIGQLVENETTYTDKYNAIVFEINDYAEHYMIGQHKDNIPQI